MEWEKWWDLFCVAVMAKHSVDVAEILRRPTTQNPRVDTLLGGLAVEAAERKVVSVLFLSLGTIARKTLVDRYPDMVVAAVPLQELLTNCMNVFARIRNRTLDRFQFFSRKQKQDETLKQFWNILTGLASRCALGEQTNSLVLDVFILNMNNTTVQEKLCTEPKDTPEEALRFAVAFEEGIQRQRSYGTGLVEKTPKIKSEPVMTVMGSKQCFRCGRPFDKDHLRKCPAKGNKCNFCGSIGTLHKSMQKSSTV